MGKIQTPFYPQAPWPQSPPFYAKISLIPIYNQYVTQKYKPPTSFRPF